MFCLTGAGNIRLKEVPTQEWIWPCQAMGWVTAITCGEIASSLQLKGLFAEKDIAVISKILIRM